MVGCYITSNDPNDPNLYEAQVKNTTTIKNPLYLSRIYAPVSGNEINITYATKQEAETTVRILEAVTVRNRSSENLKRITFSYSFFGNTADTRRLRLDKVQDGNAPPYRFTYNEQETALPDRNSSQVDHWGYYNGKSNNKHGIPRSHYAGAGLPRFLRVDPNYAPIYNETTPLVVEGADRTPEADKMKACILTRITYPTGGWVAYGYGCHTYYNSVTKKDEPWGGLRIEKVTTSDGINPANNIVTDYTYTRADNPLQSSGSVDASFIATRTGKYSHDLYHRLMVVTDRTEGSFVSNVLSQNYGMAIIEELLAETKAIYYLVRSSQAANATAELCYSRVTVQQQGKGRAVHSFTSFFDPAHRDLPPEVYYAHSKSRIDQDFAANGNGYVLNYLSKTNRRWRRGLLTDVWTFDETGKQKTWRHVNYGFRTEADAAKIVPGLVFYTTEVISKDAEYASQYPRSSFFGKYLETPEWVYVDNVTERLYDQNDDTKFRETVTRYEYNFNNLQVAATHTADGNGKTIIKRVKYAVDYPDVADDADANPAHRPGQGDRRAVVNEMLRRHMTGIPLEVQTWQQVDGGEERILSASLNEFQFIPKPEGYPWYQFTGQFSVTTGALGSFLKRTLVVPSRTLRLYALAPISVVPAPTATYQFSTLNTTTGQFTYNAGQFTEELTVSRYDSRGNGLEAQGANRPSSCSLLGNNGTLVIATVSNASYDQLAYTSFEAYGDQGNWNYLREQKQMTAKPACNTLVAMYLRKKILRQAFIRFPSGIRGAA